MPMRGRASDEGGQATSTEAGTRAERVAGWFRAPLIVAALLAIPVIVVQESEPAAFWKSLAAVLDWGIWGVFVANLIAMLAVVPDVVGGGVVFVAVEPGQELSTWDGLWWAAETVTTVAYGDIYPTTALGRLVATVVMTAGIGFVALLTGALAQRFLYGGSAGASPSPDPDKAEMMRKFDELSDQIAKLQKALEERHG